MTGTVILIRTFEREEEAVKEMHRYARNLRKQKKTGRYGVFVEKRAGSWWLNLHDRG